MRASLLCCVVVGCAGRAEPHGRPGKDRTDVPPPAPTDSGTPPTTPVVYPELSAVPIPPSTVLLGEPATEFGPNGDPLGGMSLGHEMVLVPAYGEDPGLLVLGASEPGSAAAGNTRIVPGDLPPGTVSYADHTVGTIAYRTNASVAYGPVDDFDQDGHQDLWIANYLFGGPFVGRNLGLEDAVASIGDISAMGSLAGFDADQDGHRDVLLSFDGEGRLLYGPLVGDVSPVSPDVSIVGDCIEAAAISFFWHLPDLLGPGRDAVAKSSTSQCDTAGHVYPLDIPRGSVLTTADAVAFGRAGGPTYGNEGVIQPMGDVDGDGAQDVAAGSATGLEVLRGPVQGSIAVLPQAIVWDADPAAWVTRQVGDVNGDGALDLLLFVLGHQDLPPGNDWFVLVLSPFEPVVDPWAVGIPITRRADHFGLDRPKWADLDGDGRSDLVTWGSGPDAAGEVSIWYARDLLNHSPVSEVR